MSKLSHSDNWGIDTKQTHPGYPDPDKKPRGWHNKHTDADEMRRKFSFPEFDPEEYESINKPYPNCLLHEPPGESEWGHVGGTNFLAVGEKGSGKSTLGLFWSARLMAQNNEAIVWRGSSSRSEWLPFKHWTTLILPANADVKPSWKPRDIRQQNQGEEAQLEDVVREIKYYDNPKEVNQLLEPGKFHVVYPDPSFTGCEAIMQDSDFCPRPVPFRSENEAEEPSDVTPLVHWWFAYLTAKLEYGPYDWTSLIFDEAADLAPDDARAGANETYEKVQALRRVMADSRKFYFSLFFFAHHESNLHSKIRRTMQWRISLADETANPCQSNNDRAPVGFNRIPMKYDQLSMRPVGRALIWTEQRFTRFKWVDIAVDQSDAGRWLKISLDELSQSHTRAHNTEQPNDSREVADD